MLFLLLLFLVFISFFFKFFMYRGFGLNVIFFFCRLMILIYNYNITLPVFILNNTGHCILVFYDLCKDLWIWKCLSLASMHTLFS